MAIWSVLSRRTKVEGDLLRPIPHFGIQFD